VEGGLAAVHARIATIEATFASMRAVASPPPARALWGAALADAIAGTVERGVTGNQPHAGSGAPPPEAALTPAPRLEPGQFGSLQPPADLLRFGNGHVPAHALEEIGVGSHRLWGPAARAFRQLRADAAGLGITIGVTSSYRSYESQVQVAAEKGLYSNGGLAATPGTSNHGWGMALDLDLDDRAQAWMRENAWRYGFAEDTPREPWHWGYRARV
jgi:zinc D-Ala-D-Ala carboxypeptidase